MRSIRGQLGWMNRRVESLQFLDAHPGVYLRGLEAGMTEDRLDVAGVHAAFEENRRTGMPKEMAGTLLPNSSPGDVSLGQHREVEGSNGVSKAVQEKRTIIQFVP